MGIKGRALTFGLAVALATVLACSGFPSAALADDTPTTTTTTPEPAPAPDPAPPPKPAPKPAPKPKPTPKPAPRPAPRPAQPAPRPSVTYTPPQASVTRRPVTRARPKPRAKARRQVKRAKRTVRHTKVVAAEKKTTRAVVSTPKPRTEPQVLGVAKTVSIDQANTSSPLVLAALALAILCFGAGAVPATSIGRASLAHLLAERRVGVTALGVMLLAVAVALLAAKGA